MAEGAIAVGKASEAPNDVGMQLGVLQTIGIASLAIQSHATLLIRQIFRVHERQIEEAALAEAEQSIGAARNGLIGDRARLGVGRECARFAPEQVAGKLIEQDEE